MNEPLPNVIVISVSMPEPYVRALNDQAKALGVSRSEVVRRALEASGMERLELQLPDPPQPRPPLKPVPKGSDQTPGTPAWKARMISTGQQAKIAAWAASHPTEETF